MYFLDVRRRNAMRFVAAVEIMSSRVNSENFVTLFVTMALVNMHPE